MTSDDDEFIDDITDFCSIIKNWGANANKKFIINDIKNKKIKNGNKIEKKFSQKFLAKKLHSDNNVNIWKGASIADNSNIL